MMINVRSVCGGIVLSAVGLGLTARSALAEEIWWNQPAGGSFNLPANWLQLRVPGPNDVAIFDLMQDPSYNVTFDAGVTNSGCQFRIDKVNMDLNGVIYTLYNGLDVGVFDGNSAELVLTDGTVRADTVCVGQMPGSAGVLVVGAGLTMNVSDVLAAAYYGNGTLSVTDGASVTAGWSVVGGGSTGVIEVTGPGSTYTLRRELIVGAIGNGTLNVTDGAEVTLGWIGVGINESSDGEILVDGVGSLLDAKGHIVVGDSGQGSLSVTNGARVHSFGELVVGEKIYGRGTVTVSGAGSRYQSDSGYASLIGNEGEGRLTIEDGGHVQTNGMIVIGGPFPHGGGTVRLIDNGSTLKTPGLLVGNKSPGRLIGGEGGPRVAVGDVDPQNIPGGDLHIGPNGELRGNGTVSFDVANLSGVVDPGGSDAPEGAPGVLTVTGNFEQQAGGRLLIEIGGTQRGIEYSALDVSDDVTLDGELEIRIVNGFEPQLGDTFEIMTFASHTGEFATIRGQDLGNGLFCAVFYRDTDVTIVVSECIDIANFKPKGKKGKIKFSMDTTLPDRQKVTVTATNTNTGEEFPKKKKAKKGRVRSKIKNLAAGKYDVCVTETPNCGQGCFEKGNVKVK